MQRYARLLARELAAWVIVDVEGGQRLRRQHVSGPEDQRSEKLANAVAAVDPAPGSGPYQVHESGSTLLIAHAEDPGALGDGPDGIPLLMLLGATSVLSVPLTDGEHAYGVLTLARWAGHPHFEIADVGLVEELGEQLALAIRVDRMFRHRVDIADALQTSLLPRQVRQIPGTEIAAAHVAATMAAEAGGDFYDVYPSRDGWGVAIGDVCGTGPDTAAVTAAARHAIRALAHLDADPTAVLRGINDIMLTEDFGGRFVTADAGHLSWREGRLHLSLSSAGHPGPVLLRPDGRTQVLNGGGLPLGIFPDAEPATQELDLETGDLVFLYTDGLTSACGPDLVQFEERLTDELAALAGKPAAVLVSRVRDVVLELCQGELRDDVTMLALRVGEPPALIPASSALAVFLGVRFLEGHAEPRPVRGRGQDPAVGVQGAVEEHPFDPLMVVEVLDVAQAGHGHAGMCVQIRRAVRGNLQVVRGGQGGAAEELGEAAAPGRVELQAVHRARLDEPRRVSERPAVLPGGHVGEHLTADRGQPCQVLAGHRLLEPGHAVRRPAGPRPGRPGRRCSRRWRPRTVRCPRRSPRGPGPPARYPCARCRPSSRRS